jgi:hypothetical protein
MYQNIVTTKINVKVMTVKYSGSFAVKARQTERLLHIHNGTVSNNCPLRR